jgi:hypothetical protein
MLAIGDVVRTTRSLRGLYDRLTLRAGIDGVVTRVMAGGTLVEVAFEGDDQSLAQVIVQTEHLERVAMTLDLGLEWDPIAVEHCISQRPYLAPPMPDFAWHARPVKVRQRSR